jgi:hypothetical protein
MLENISRECTSSGELKSWITVTISYSRTLRCLNIDISMHIKKMEDLLCSSKKCVNYVGDQYFWTLSSPNASYSSYRSYSVNIFEWHLIILTRIFGRWSFILRIINLKCQDVLSCHLFKYVSNWGSSDSLECSWIV